MVNVSKQVFFRHIYIHLLACPSVCPLKFTLQYQLSIDKKLSNHVAKNHQLKSCDLLNRMVGGISMMPGVSFGPGSGLCKYPWSAIEYFACTVL